MAFESLSDRFARIFKKLRGQSRLSESNMEEMLKEIRVALLEADVNFKVVKDFLTEVRKRAIGAEVLTKLNPSQTIVKIVHDEIEKLLGSSDDQLVYNRNKPTVILLVGLQAKLPQRAFGRIKFLPHPQPSYLPFMSPALILLLHSILTAATALFRPTKPANQVPWYPFPNRVIYPGSITTSLVGQHPLRLQPRFLPIQSSQQTQLFMHSGPEFR